MRLKYWRPRSVKRPAGSRSYPSDGLQFRGVWWETTQAFPTLWSFSSRTPDPQQYIHVYLNCNVIICGCRQSSTIFSQSPGTEPTSPLALGFHMVLTTMAFSRDVTPAIFEGLLYVCIYNICMYVCMHIQYIVVGRGSVTRTNTRWGKFASSPTKLPGIVGRRSDNSASRRVV